MSWFDDIGSWIGNNANWLAPAGMAGASIPRDVLALLRRVAAERANREGGRASVSGVLASLALQNRQALESEVGR